MIIKLLYQNKVRKYELADDARISIQITKILKIMPIFKKFAKQNELTISIKLIDLVKLLNKLPTKYNNYITFRILKKLKFVEVKSGGGGLINYFFGCFGRKISSLESTDSDKNKIQIVSNYDGAKNELSITYVSSENNLGSAIHREAVKATEQANTNPLVFLLSFVNTP